ncbi:phosphoglucosamine mutase [Desulfofundulus thermocisternus]|uniref:phosphoglucosamine mutase n=1 Tax=Desulfofundulus thermocisternus TaxID=42471 RepID=UPI0019EA669E|nr:phosphoglucosamine mutase [Desulfofundulus thermocisternus]MBE3586067.1 phosphoglucosamine mutase [Thermoanaerobacter sp.]MCS5695001.1 phosphoglucosamine mutase [Desulfofundulus thermocisternus]
MGAIFGTDGVRGVANRELTPELALNLGRAGAYVLSRGLPGASLVVGWDTRISSDMLEAALTAGICSAGVNVLKVGVMPTAAIAYLTRALGAAGGAVISASHNPMDDNGIKFFGASGYKLSDAMEEEIEQLLSNPACIPAPVGARVGRLFPVADAADRYIAFLKDTVSCDFSGLKVVVDCANGAASRIAPRVLAELGAEVIPIFNTPDGVNINAGCGSTHPAALQEAVVEYGAHLGLAHDGDADRVIAVDGRGNLVDGDQIMVILARALQKKGRLARDTVVVTVMSNLGLDLALEKSGIRVLKTRVGDRYVLEELLRSGATFGGEQSGHIIMLDYNTTGDGILTALQLLQVVRETGATLQELAAQMEKLPQLLENVRVTDKEKVMGSPELARAIREQEERLGGQGRILVRPSGTEPLVRVMVEGRDMELLRSIAGELVEVIHRVSS